MSETFMAMEIAESGAVLRRQLDANRDGDRRARRASARGSRRISS